MIFRQLQDAESSTWTYVLGDEKTGQAVLIDPVTANVDRDLTVLDELGLTLRATLDTHVHADHVTAAWELKQRTGCEILYPEKSEADGADRLLAHGEVVRIGALAIEVRHTPGHTQESVTYVVDDMAFTGDTLLIRGCGRTDFQGGSSEDLYRSVHEQIFTLPDTARIFPGHDYHGRTMSTVAEEKAYNPRLGNGRELASFVQLMDGLDLAYPKKIDIAVPANRALGRPTDPWAELKRSPNGALQASLAWVEAHGDQVRLIDVRGPDEFHGPLGHLNGAELVPLNELARAARGWDLHTPVVTVCRSGGRSDRAAIALENAGFTHVASLTGGMMGVRDTTTHAACG